MSKWGDMIEGVGEVTGCKSCVKGTMHPNYDALLSANKVNINFSYDGDATPTLGKPKPKGLEI